MTLIARRAFLVGVPVSVVAARSVLAAGESDERIAGAAAAATSEPAHITLRDDVSHPAGATPSVVPTGFPAQDPALVQEIVGKSHFDLDVVRVLIKDRPSLAKASWDWGFGDWETALGAASHVGRHDIVEVLMASGARPDVFTFAMLDHVDAVRAIVEANPGAAVQKIHGPHGITLMAHARNGEAQRVIDYLSTIEGADVPQTNLPLEEAVRQRYLGDYSFCPGEDGALSIVEMKNQVLGLQRGGARRQLMHQGDHTFHPTGAASVRIYFRLGDTPAGDVLSVHDADLIVTARRVAG